MKICLNGKTNLYVIYRISSNKHRASNKHRTFWYTHWNKHLPSNKCHTSKYDAY